MYAFLKKGCVTLIGVGAGVIFFLPKRNTSMKWFKVKGKFTIRQIKSNSFV
jgi:hypothetical protein